jgi:hypothetical protein
MAQDYTPKLRSIASDCTIQARSLLSVVQALTNDAALLAQSGGNYPDGIFDGTPLAYMTAYQINVFLQSVVPAVNAFLDSHLDGDTAQATYREYFQMIVAGPSNMPY